MVTPPLGLDLHSVKVIVEEEKSLLTLTTQPQKKLHSRQSSFVLSRILTRLLCNITLLDLALGQTIHVHVRIEICHD